MSCLRCSLRPWRLRGLFSRSCRINRGSCLNCRRFHAVLATSTAHRATLIEFKEALHADPPCPSRPIGRHCGSGHRRSRLSRLSAEGRGSGRSALGQRRSPPHGAAHLARHRRQGAAERRNLGAIRRGSRTTEDGSTNPIPSFQLHPVHHRQRGVDRSTNPRLHPPRVATARCRLPLRPRCGRRPARSRRRQTVRLLVFGGAQRAHKLAGRARTRRRERCRAARLRRLSRVLRPGHPRGDRRQRAAHGRPLRDRPELAGGTRRPALLVFKRSHHPRCEHPHHHPRDPCRSFRRRVVHRTKRRDPTPR